MRRKEKHEFLQEILNHLFLSFLISADISQEPYMFTLKVRNTQRKMSAFNIYNQSLDVFCFYFSFKLVND